ncbi:hypothetical protein MVES1_002893 [Malassezia vespertilionis]|uniref:PCI domain-containing protein n=1 Tax=Malassezia vespertilionis TaxID=2020962 RepID=A0A2N1J962_9BASI|nr:uncharacterized protein MVES1_002893 [Malassezia vespertilionis]PKI83099.1 hypothetical protein MVES_002742 [Malassezia vespertilionis]WFD07527.1 hypothetical protein MVES1_002893 [Malassezia vespertilionis]
MSFRAYFKLNNTRLCETVLGSVQNALLMNRRNAPNGAETSGEEGYPMADRVTYRYYLGQIRLIQHQIEAGAEHLRWAFDHCTNAQLHNKRKILIPLVAAYLVMGRYASRSLLEECQLTSEFGNMIRYHQLGYGAGVRREIERHCDWLRTKGLYMILYEKAMLGAWRNLFRRCLQLAPGASGSSNAPPTLCMNLLVGPARLAWEDASLGLDDIECIAANLVDQGLMKAYILHSKGLIVLQKGPYFGFPPLASTYLA